jgi:microcystin-dependent protein
VYAAPPGTTATTLTAISSSAYNALVVDLVTDANAARPVSAGGTGASSASAALTNLGGTTTGKAVFTAADVAAALVALGLTGAAPAGQIGYFAGQAPPAGWIKANGSNVSRTTYAALFAQIGTAYGPGDGSTTFTLPDLRGVFPRGWDDGRGLDPARGFGNYQPDAMLNHTHTGVTDAQGEHSHQLSLIVGATSGNTSGLLVGNSTANENPTSRGSAILGGAHAHNIITGNQNVGNGPETRPKNVALLVCIKV